MTNRPSSQPGTHTSRSTITFAAPFRLEGMDMPQAAGTYKIDSVQETDQGSGSASRPVSTRIYLRVGGSIRIRAVDRQELRRAWQSDRDARPYPANGLGGAR